MVKSRERGTGSVYLPNDPGRRSLRRAGKAWDHLRDHIGDWKTRAITANALENYASDRLKEAAPASIGGATGARLLRRGGCARGPRPR
jgi:hypothetical protein